MREDLTDRLNEGTRREFERQARIVARRAQRNGRSGTAGRLRYGRCGGAGGAQNHSFLTLIPGLNLCLDPRQLARRSALDLLLFGTALQLSSLCGVRACREENGSARFSRRLPPGLLLWFPSAARVLRNGRAPARACVISDGKVSMISSGEPLSSDCVQKKIDALRADVPGFGENFSGGGTPDGRTVIGSLSGYLFLLRRSVMARSTSEERSQCKALGVARRTRCFTKRTSP